MSDYHDEDSSFVEHTECEACGSSDGNALYSDGHTHCFVCGQRKPPPKGWTGFEAQPEKKLEDVNFYETTCKQLDARSLLKKTLQWFGYGFSKKSNGTPIHVAPFYRDGVMVAQHTRDREKNFGWVGITGKLELFGQHRWKSGGKQLIITEGEIDCMTVCQVLNYRWPVVSVPNGAQSAKKYVKQNLEWIESFQTVKFLFDNDKEGNEAVKECAALLSPAKAKIVRLPDGCKDPNYMVCNGLTKELTNRIMEAEDYKPDGVFSLKNLRDRYRHRPAIRKVDFPFRLLNKMLNGCQPKRIYLWTAGSGIGKSTVVQQIIFWLRKFQKRKVGIIALEEDILETIDRHVALEMQVSMAHLREFVPIEVRMEVFDKLCEDDDMFLYDHFGSQDPNGILSTIRFLVVSCGCTDIVLDHISIVVSGMEEGRNGEGSERKMIDILMTKLRSMVQEAGAFTLHAIVHLKRPDKGKSFNEGRQVSLSDLRGSASLEQLSDVVISVERDQQSDTPNLLWLRVLKNRPNGETGIADYLEYDRDTGWLKEVTPENATKRESAAYQDDEEEVEPQF